ncbi:hypothetical protein AMELA_G00053200, partial [Ameiurus melas]
MPYRPGIGGSDGGSPPLSTRMGKIKGRPSAPGGRSTDLLKRLRHGRGRRRPRRRAALRDDSRTPRLLPGFPPTRPH